MSAAPRHAGKSTPRASSKPSRALTLLAALEVTLVVQLQVLAQEARPRGVEEAPASSSAPSATPTRPLPAETIRLADGSTTFVSTLEEYLQRDASSASQLQLEREEDPRPARGPAEGVRAPEIPASGSGRTNATSAAQQQQQQQPLPAERQQEHSKPGQPQPASQAGQQAKPIQQHWQMRGLLNVTRDYPLPYSRIIYGYIWPMVAMITLFSNLMITFVLTQRDMRTPTNVVLTAIAIADIIPIIVPVPSFIYLFAMGNERVVLFPPIACYFYQHLTRSVSEIFYFLSTWLNVLLAVQDYLTACWPHLAKRYCKIRVVILQIVSLTLLAFLMNLPQALKLVFKPVKFYYNGRLTWGCRMAQAKWFKDLVGDHVALYDDIFTAVIVLCVDGGPALLLITLTALLIRQLQQQRIQGHLLMEQARTASKRRRERHRQQEYESSARVMIFVLIAFLAVKIPFATTYTLMIIQSHFEVQFMENLADFQKWISLTDLVFVLSYPLNFTIFCCCSKKFRHKCAQLLERTKSARGRLVSRLSSGSCTSDNVSQLLGQRQPRDSQATLSSDQLATSAPAPLKPTSLSTGQSMSRSPALAMAASASALKAANVAPLDEPLTMGGPRRASEGRAGQAAPSSASPAFRALLADGTLCLECIMRYEQLRRAQPPTRRPSADSGSWPSGFSAATIPPAAPALQMPLAGAQHQQPHLQHQHQHHQQLQSPQLPHIVTTRCESIREHPNSSEDEQPSRRLADELAHARRKGAADSQLLVSESGSSYAINSIQTDMSEPDGAHEGRAGLGDGDQDAELQEEQAALEESLSSNTTLVTSRPLRRPIATQGSRPSTSSSVSQICSDPGESRQRELRDCRLSDVRDLRAIQRQASKRAHYDGRMLAPDGRQLWRRAPMKSQMSADRRSLSLSNSKLTTLPDATGRLADVLLTTLFAPLRGAQTGRSSQAQRERPALSRQSCQADR